MPRKFTLVVAFIAVAATCWWCWRWFHSAGSSVHTDLAAAPLEVAEQGVPLAVNVESAKPQLEPLDTAPTPAESARQLRIAEVRRAVMEGSLRGTAVDGAIHVDGNGQLLMDMDLRRWFDYHLSVVGESTPQAIRDYLVEQLQHTQSATVMAQVLAAFDRYVAYLAAIDDAAAGLQSATEEQRDALLRRLQLQLLGAAQTSGFFADEHAYADYRQERTRLLRDPRINAEERAQRLEQLIDQLPPGVQDALVQHQRSTEDLELAMQINNSGMDEQARFESRERAFGAEAAARLEQADREQALWQQQLAADTQIRQQLAAELGLSESERRERLNTWRSQHLDEQQRQRIEALEEIGQLPQQVPGSD